MAENDAYRRLRNLFGDKSYSASLTTAATTQNDVITPRNANHTLYVQRILVNVITASAQNWTFRDDNSTPKDIAFLPNSAAAGVHEFDFGPEGIPLTLGKNLDIVISGAGVAAAVKIEAYEKLGAVVAHTGTL
jgi:hypothetical protein